MPDPSLMAELLRELPREIAPGTVEQRPMRRDHLTRVPPARE